VNKAALIEAIVKEAGLDLLVGASCAAIPCDSH